MPGVSALAGGVTRLRSDRCPAGPVAFCGAKRRSRPVPSGCTAVMPTRLKLPSCPTATMSFVPCRTEVLEFAPGPAIAAPATLAPPRLPTARSKVAPPRRSAPGDAGTLGSVTIGGVRVALVATVIVLLAAPGAQLLTTSGAFRRPGALPDATRQSVSSVRPRVAVRLPAVLVMAGWSAPREALIGAKGRMASASCSRPCRLGPPDWKAAVKPGRRMISRSPSVRTTVTLRPLVSVAAPCGPASTTAAAPLTRTSAFGVPIRSSTPSATEIRNRPRPDADRTRMRPDPASRSTPRSVNSAPDSRTTELPSEKAISVQAPAGLSTRSPGVSTVGPAADWLEVVRPRRMTAVSPSCAEAADATSAAAAPPLSRMRRIRTKPLPFLAMADIVHLPMRRCDVASSLR